MTSLGALGTYPTPDISEYKHTCKHTHIHIHRYVCTYKHTYVHIPLGLSGLAGLRMGEPFTTELVV